MPITRKVIVHPLTGDYILETRRDEYNIVRTKLTDEQVNEYLQANGKAPKDPVQAEVPAVSAGAKKAPATVAPATPEPVKDKSGDSGRKKKTVAV